MEPPPPVREYHRSSSDNHYREPRGEPGPPNRGEYQLPPGPPPPSSSSSSRGDGYHHHRDDLPPGPSRHHHSSYHHRDPYDDVYDHPRERESGSSGHGRLPPPSSRSLPYKILCVANLNSKVSDSSIRDALIHEFARFGEVSVKIIHDSNERFAYLYFRCYEDAREARHAKYRLVLFDKPVEIDPIYEKLPPPLPPPPPPPHHHHHSRLPPPPPSDDYRSSRGRSMTPPEYHHHHHHSRSRSPGGYRSSSRPLPPPSSGGHLPPPSVARVDRHGNPYPVRSYRDDRYPDHHSHYSSSSRGGDPYRSSRGGGSSSGGGDPYDHSHPRPLPSSSRLPSSPSHPSSNGGSGSRSAPSGSSGASSAQRENKKDKFPNYLHHVAPEEDVNATRTLFVGNLELSISEPELRRIFEKYGVLEDIDVKRPPPGQGNAYAFIKFLNLDMAHRAKVEMSGQYIGKFQCKIGYGKATPTTRIWVGGLGSWTSLSVLEHEFDRFGAIRKIDFVKGDNHAYILFDTIDAATAAIQEMRGFPLGGQDKRLRVDFADPGVYSGEPGQEGVDATTVAATDGTVVVDASLEPPVVVGGSTSEVLTSGTRTPPLEGAAAVVENNNNGTERSSSSYLLRRPHDDTIEDVVAVKRPRVTSTPDGDASNDSAVISNNHVPSIRTDLITFDDKYEDVVTISDLANVTKVVWTGGLKLKNSSFPCQMHHCSGDVTLVDMFMGDQSGLCALAAKDGMTKTDDGAKDEKDVETEETIKAEDEAKDEPDKKNESAENNGSAKDDLEVAEDELLTKAKDEEEVKQKSSSSFDTSTNYLPLIKITQRLRLDVSKLEDVSKRIKSAGSRKCLLLVSSVPSEVQPRIPLEVVTSGECEKLSLRQLKNLISYFKARESAGVANLTLNSVNGNNSTTSTTTPCVSGNGENGNNGETMEGINNNNNNNDQNNIEKVFMYCFPTCDYSNELIKKIAPNFNSTTSPTVPKEEFLLVLLVKG